MEEHRIERLEERMTAAEQKIEKQAVEQAETRVYVKEIYKRMDEIKTSIIAITASGKDDKSDKDSDRWAKVVERAFWAIVTIVGYFVGKGGV